MGHAMHAAGGVQDVRICSNDCNNWINIQNPPDEFHDFWECSTSGRVSVSVKTATGGSYSRQAGWHDCPSGKKSSINQIAGSTNSQTCFEMNGRSSDSNHHWAIWHSCNGGYVNCCAGPQTRTGWARVMMR